MTIQFDRPIGTPADLKELEYLSALHQTCFPKLRQDASIDAHDIANFLSSRHGIQVDVKTINKEIMVELGGDLRADPMYKLDLCQVVAMLLIPHFSQHEKMLQTVLNAISPQSPKLTRQFMKKLLESQGEVDVPSCLLDDMMNAVGGEGTTLSTSSLLRAVTSDATLYGIDWHKRLTTHYQDVFSSHGDDNVEKTESTSASDEETPIPTKPRPITQLSSAAAIDTVADTYQSQMFTVLLWVCMVVVYLAYFSDFELKWGQVDCSDLSEFTCTMVVGIARWLVLFIELTCFGTAFIIFGSAGNAIYKSKWMAFGHLVIGMATILFATILSLVHEVDTAVVNTTKKERYEAAYYVAAVIGGMLLLLQLIFLIRLFFPLEVWKKHALLERILTPGILKMERSTKLAAHRKVSLLVENALRYHHDRSTFLASSKSSQSTALVNFQSTIEQTEKAGGLVWGWRKVWDGSICEQEGVWLHSRLIACNVAQFFICIFTIAFWAVLLMEGLRKIESGNDTVNTDDDYGSDVYVWEVVVAGSVGILSGLLACFAIAIMYIPSFISSVLQLRSGVIPSLRDTEFLMYRYAEDQVTLLFGSAIWGCLFTGSLATVFVGGVVFIAVWHETRQFMMTLLAHFVGFAVTFGLKMIVLCFLRRQFRAAFYRTQPLKENIMNVMLECWNLGLSSGFMLIRTIKLLLITACYLGRMDTPLLANGVGFIGPIALDAYPIAFRKDLLQHDAHRHPYLERLAALYMMKLRYGNAFGKRANSCWRLLVVLCLMPWMRKYRLGTAFIEEWEEEAETEKEKSTENTRFSALKRLKSTRHLGHMEGVTSREDLLEREVTILRERNQKLMEEITNLRERSVDSEVFHDAVESLNGDLYLNETIGDNETQCVFSESVKCRNGGYQQGGDQDDWQLTMKAHEHLL